MKPAAIVLAAVALLAALYAMTYGALRIAAYLEAWLK